MAEVVPPTGIDRTGAVDVGKLLGDWLATVPSGSTVRLRETDRFRCESPLRISTKPDVTIEGDGAVVFARTPSRDATWASAILRDCKGIVVNDLRLVGGLDLAKPPTAPGLGAGWQVERCLGVTISGCGPSRIDGTAVRIADSSWVDLSYLGIEQSQAAITVERSTVVSIRRIASHGCRNTVLRAFDVRALLVSRLTERAVSGPRRGSPAILLSGTPAARLHRLAFHGRHARLVATAPRHMPGITLSGITSDVPCPAGIPAVEVSGTSAPLWIGGVEVPDADESTVLVALSGVQTLSGVSVADAWETDLWPLGGVVLDGIDPAKVVVK